MSLRPYVGFVGPSATEESRIAAYDELYNWYPSKVESGTGPARWVLYPTPGYANFVTTGDSPGRGGLSIGGTSGSGSINGNTYFVSGTTLYLYSATPTSLASGIVNALDGVVQMVTNGDQGHQLLFSSDSTVYCFDTTSLVLTNVGVNGVSVGYLNRYGLALNSADSEFRFSALNDFSTWSALDVVVREDAADNWVRLIVYHNEIWLFGSRTTSIYYNSDDPDTPFLPIKSAFMNMGIAAANSACIVGGSLFWIGQDVGGNCVVYRANGYTPERVSTHAVEYAFSVVAGNGSGALIDAEGSYYQQNGHDFYKITLPSRDLDLEGGYKGETWNYDATEGLWSKEGDWNGLQYQQMDTRGFFAGPNISLSRTSGKIYSVLPTHSTGTNGLGIKRLRRAPHINQAQYRIRYSHFRLLMEVGLGSGSVVSTDPAYDPQISLSWSDDGGQTFGASYTVSAGKIGEFNTLVEWRQLGQARDRIFQITCDSPTPWRLVDAFLDYTVGPS